LHHRFGRARLVTRRAALLVILAVASLVSLQSAGAASGPSASPRAVEAATAYTWQGKRFTSVAALRRHLARRHHSLEVFLRTHPPAVRAFGLRGVRWSDRTFYTPRGMAGWLAVRGRSYRAWSSIHRVAAAKLRRNARATVRRTTSAADTTAFAPVADAYIDASKPAASYGSSTKLLVDSSPRRVAYLRFDVQGLAGTVDRAVLSVAPSGKVGAGYEVRAVADGVWDERALTNANAPAVADASTAVLAPTGDGRLGADVTALVRGPGALSLAVVATAASGRLSFGSRESDAGPRLTVETTPPPQPESAPPPPPPPAPPPANPYSGRVGVASGTMWAPEAEQLAALRRAREGGITWIREDFHWGAFEREPGVWDWSYGDRLMRSAATVGVDVLGVIAYSAHWGAAGSTIYHPPADPAAYASFCRAVVNRYGAGGTFWTENAGLTPRPLQAVEIWNEPWLHYFWRSNPDPAAYSRLVRAAASAIREAHPEIKILVSADVFQTRSDTQESLDWFRLLLPTDPDLFRNLVDAYSVHLYSQSRDPLDSTTPQRWRFDRVLMTRDLAAQAGAPHPIWVTEFGWSTYGGHPDSVSEETQARYIREGLRRTVEDWGSFVERSFVYQWGNSSDSYGGGHGLLRADGSAKPAWEMLVSLLR
jgi:hypothetical protein